MVNFQKKKNEKKLIKFDRNKGSLTIKKIKLEPIKKFDGSPSDLVECIVKEEFIDEKYHHIKENEEEEDSIEIQMEPKGSSELINELRVSFKKIFYSQ